MSPIDTSGFAFPKGTPKPSKFRTPLRRTAMKPKRRPSGERTMKDGRQVLDGADYRARKLEAIAAYDGQCGKCGAAVTMETADLDHKRKRGMGGGTRDDRLRGADGTLETGNVWPLCRRCHMEKHQ